MRAGELLKKLQGIQTIETVMDSLDVTRNKAIYYVFRLRKKGYVKTKKLSNNKRVYNISFENKLNGKNYYDIINQHAPFKIITPITYNIYGKELKIEETIIYALKTKSVRIILAMLSLFRYVTDWSYLYQLSKQNNLERQVGALYDLTRSHIRVRKMTKRFRNNALSKKKYDFKWIIQGLKSRDFKKIEKQWKIFIPFNLKDLEVYKK